MAVFGFSACNGDYDDWAAPQSNAQENAITIPGYTAAAAGAIDLNQAGESINMFTLSSAALPEGSTVENNRVKLTPTGEGVKDELSKTIELTADCKADSAADKVVKPHFAVSRRQRKSRESDTAADEMRAAYKAGFKDGASLMREIQE